MVLVFSGECGESTVTRGGGFWEGVTGPIDCGRALGKLGRRPLTTGSRCPSSTTTVEFVEVVWPIGVVGLASLAAPAPDKKGERPTIGDAGGVPLSLSRFSNLERSEDTGLMEDSSLPSPASSILPDAPTSREGLRPPICAQSTSEPHTIQLSMETLQPIRNQRPCLSEDAKRNISWPERWMRNAAAMYATSYAFRP